MNFQEIRVLSFLMCLLFLSSQTYADSNKSKQQKCPLECVTTEEYQSQNNKFEKKIDDLDERVLILRNSLADLYYRKAENEKGVFDSALQAQSFYLAVYGGIIVLVSIFLGFFGYTKLTDIEESLNNKLNRRIDEKIKAALDEAIQQTTLADNDSIFDDLNQRIKVLEDRTITDEMKKKPRSPSTKTESAGNAFDKPKGKKDD